MTPRSSIRLVVSDIDGTLVTKAKVLTPRARAAIEAMKARGIGFAVASARPPLGLRHIVAELGLEVPVGAVNGGAVMRPDGSLVDALRVPADAVRTTVAVMRREGIDPWLFTDRDWFLRDPEGAHVDHEAKTLDMAPTVVEDFTNAQIAGALKLVGASHDHPLLADCERILQAERGAAELASRSQSYYLDVTHANATKGQAVIGIARELGVPLEAVMTIGDGHNDTPMFAVSGFSVAMGNGPEAVRQLASVVTDSNEDEGFAKAIERYVLGQGETGRA